MTSYPDSYEASEQAHRPRGPAVGHDRGSTPCPYNKLRSTSLTISGVSISALTLKGLTPAGLTLTRVHDTIIFKHMEYLPHCLESPKRYGFHRHNVRVLHTA